MKTPRVKIHQLSSFRPRQSRGRGKTVNFYEGFWKELVLKAYWWVVYLPPRVWAWAKKRDHTITIKIRWVVAGLLVLALWPRPGHIVYGDPIAPAPHVVVPKPQVPLPETPLAHVEPLAPAPVPVPVVPVYVPPAPAIGCGSDPYMAQIYMHESGCNTASVNSIGCAGLGQACPGSKLPCSLSDWACQNAFFVNYANSVYGSPAAAWAAWQVKHWW